MPRTIAEIQDAVRSGVARPDLRGLDSISEIEEGVVTVGGGALCGDVEKRAVPWLLACDRPERTVAEWIGEGGGGLLWEILGPTRAQVLGLRAVLADGRCVTFGGKVVKNVAGYDLTRAFVGAGGTLGVVVEAHLRLRPPPVRWHACARGGTDWRESMVGPGCAVWNEDTIRFLRAGEKMPPGYAALDPLEAREHLRRFFAEVGSFRRFDPEDWDLPCGLLLAGPRRVGTADPPRAPSGPLWERLRHALDPEGFFQRVPA